MKLHASRPSGVNTITGYGEGYVMVNGERRASSVVVLADRIEAWSVERFDALTAEHFRFLTDLEVDIVLLGTGPRQRFPHPRLTAALAQAGIGLEVMDLHAACRTYNILVAEERKVAAALLFE
ncbi:MAG TPA: Mth938-like domain-containing protein [Burkholderiales bacterium]|nr:Mth938-like domain-containing protein [Burkholderiales bacterium]